MTVCFPIFAPCRASCLAAFGGIVAWLQRVESLRVEKKIDKADIGNAAVHFHLYGLFHKDESARHVHRVVTSNAICKEAA